MVEANVSAVVGIRGRSRNRRQVEGEQNQAVVATGQPHICSPVIIFEVFWNS